MKLKSIVNLRNWTGFSVKHPTAIILTAILFTVFFAFQLSQLEYKTTINDMIFRDTPSADQYESFKSIFGSQEIILVVIRGKDIFNPEIFKAATDLSNRLSEIKGVKRVISLPKIKEEMSVSKELGLEEFRKIIEPVELFRKNLISSDGKSTVISLVLDDASSRGDIVHSVEDLISSNKQGLTIYQAGIPVVVTELSKYVEYDFHRLPLITLILLIILVFIFFQNLKIVCIYLGSVISALIWTLGLMSLTGTALSMITVIVPVFVIAVGTAYCMYIFPHYSEALKKNNTPGEAVYEAFSNVGVPTSLAVITTTIGVGSLMLNRINAVRDFALFSCAGIWCILLIILVVLPAILTRFPLTRGQADFGRLARNILNPLLKLIIKLDLNYKKVSIPFLIIISVIGIAGIFRINVETNPVSYFRNDAPVSRNFHDIYRDLAGSFPVNVVIDSRQSGYFEDPANLKHMAELQVYMGSLPLVDKTISALDYLKLVKYAKNKYEKEYYTLPEKGYEVRMLMNDYKSMLGQDMYELFIDNSASKLNIMLRTHISSSRGFLEIKEDIKHYLGHNLPDNFETSVTGLGIVISDSNLELAESQLKGFSIAFILIFFIMLMLFLSVKVGFISIIPNLFPLIVCLGTLGWFKIDFSISTSLIMGIVIGLAVDDTIHYLVTYDLTIRRTLNRSKALTDTLRTVGGPIICTTFIIAAGFSVLMYSQFRPTSIFGLLMVVTMLSALIGDIILLPSLMLNLELVTVWDLLRLSLGKDPQKEITLFRGLSRIQVRYILMVGNMKRLENNEVLFYKGEISDSMYVVISGELALTDVPGAQDNGRNDQVSRLITYLKTGDVVGVPGVVRSARRSATVIAVKPTELLQINEQMIRRLQLLYPPTAHRFFFNLMSLICKRLENVTRGFSRLTAVDTLTGVYSRDFFIEFLDKELYRIRHFGGNLTLLVMELDQLGKINEVHGHSKGDYILWEVASFIQSNVRECDMACRFTGTAIGIMLINYEEDDLKKLSEYLREQLGKIDFGNSDTSIRITVSIGLAVSRPEMNDSSATIVEKAMTALNRARESGMNRVEFFSRGPYD